MNELAIGEIGEIDGVKVKCVEYVSGGEYDCDQCIIPGGSTECKKAKCTSFERHDGKEVHFEEVKS